MSGMQREPSDMSFNLMFLLNTTDSLTNLQMANILDKDKASTHKALQELEERNLVSKLPSHRYAITKKGIDIINKKIERSPFHEQINKSISEFRSNPKNKFLFALFSVGAITWIGWKEQSAHATVETIASVSGMPTAATGSGTGVSKVLIAVITVTVISGAGGGIYAGDAYFSDLELEYAVNPPHSPAELHGVELSIQKIYSTDRKSYIVSYDCNAEPIIYEFPYSFTCTAKNNFGNEQQISATIDSPSPDSELSMDARHCIEEHYEHDSDWEIEYPYLSKIIYSNDTKLNSLKKDHIKMMDDYFELKEYANSKKHAYIILKYFDAENIQALSTLGNIIRDENRRNTENLGCAIAIHENEILQRHVWGKLSLAEDNHVLGNFDVTIELTTDVINDDKIQEAKDSTSYWNALVIKGNALFMKALIHGPVDFGPAHYHYTTAHQIKESYGTWLGLGNIDRQLGNCEDALEKYEYAKQMAKDTREVDYLMDLCI